MTHFEGRTQLWEMIGSAIERAGTDVAAISSEIFENPEPALNETRAARLLTEYFASSGFEIESNLAGMPTAFQATMRNFDPEAMRKGLRHGHVAILAEYDAEDSGHLSGRQLVAGGAIATAIGLAEALREVHGQVTLIGCPAATTLDGKRRLASDGVFEPADAALGLRPAPAGNGFQPIITSTGETIASARVAARFSGLDGESDARRRLATAAGSLATDLAETDTLETTLSETGIEFDLRAASNPDMKQLISRLKSLANDVATETGSMVAVEVMAESPAFNVNRVLARRLKTFADSIGMKQDPVTKTPPSAPSDWGHVSLVTATVQAAFLISENEVAVGTQAFAEASASDYAHRQMLACSKAVAYTGLDLLADMEFRGFAEGELIRSLKAQGIERKPRRWLGVHPVKPRETSNGHTPRAGRMATTRGDQS